jgi:DNA-binding CsgD family transcriptional regulator
MAESPAISKTGDPEPDISDLRQRVQMPVVTSDRATIIVALRRQGHTYKEIRGITGLTLKQIQYALRNERAKGTLNDVLAMVDHEAVPQAVENLIGMLRKHDKDATMLTLKGRGVFRTFSQQKHEVAAGEKLPMLTIDVTSPDGNSLPSVIVNSERGAVEGVAREDEE